MTPRLEGKVIHARSGFFDVETTQGVVQCRLRGRLKKERQSADIAVVGDDVLISLGEDGTGALEEVRPRRSRFSRRQPGPSGRWKEDVMVANLDTLVAVFAFQSPTFHSRMLDRFLVIAEHNLIDAIIVANKVDLEQEPTMREELRVYREVGYPLHLVSAKYGRGIDPLRAAILGKTAAFAGPSGAGKSSLMMALEPALSLKVGETSEAHGKGKHTTRSAELHPLSGGGYLVDTPGIRELGTWELPPSELASCFPEIRPFLDGCRFRDCSHLKEPACAVRAAVERGEVSEARFDSYQRLFAGDDLEGRGH